MLTVEHKNYTRGKFKAETHLLEKTLK